jgi:uncharacterized protein YndB with AHSA1/START domain
MNETESRPGDNAHELVIERIFDAPRKLVWKMWTEKEHALQWGGPRDYPMVQTEADVRPGGKWRSCLRSVETGEELWQGGVYSEVVEPERLVFTFAWDEDSGQSTTHETLVTITFTEQEGKTKMTFRQTPFKSLESRDGHREGWNSSFDRLDSYLREQTKQ